MSLILGYADKGNAIIMSDGRAGGTISPSETYNKTIKINENIIIGFAGIKERIEFFLFHILKEMGSHRNEYYVDDFLDMMDFHMKEKDTQIHLKSSFIIIGRTRQNDMVTSIVGNVTNFKIEKNIVLSPRLLTIGGTVDGNIINDIYFKNAKNSESPLEYMKNTIIQVSQIDNSVNSNIFYSSI